MFVDGVLMAIDCFLLDFVCACVCVCVFMLFKCIFDVLNNYCLTVSPGALFLTVFKD